MFKVSKRERRSVAGLVTAAVVGMAFYLITHFDPLHQTKLQSSDFFFKAADAGGKANPPESAATVYQG
jgi:hypothetical protein